MRKIIYLFLIFISFLYLGCTAGGIEWALIGTWKTYKAEGNLPEKFEETFVISSNDKIIIYQTYEYNGGAVKRIARGEGYINADYQAKTFSTDYYSLRFYDDGVRQSDSVVDSERSQYEGPYKYQLENNNYTLIITNYKDSDDFTIYMSKVE